MNLQKNIKRILREETSKIDLIKSTLFDILNKSKYVEKFDYIWSPNLVTGAPIMYVKNLSEEDFFNERIDLFDLIGGLWPYGEEDYLNWKTLYYGLVYGYAIKDKNSKTKILIQITRFEDNFKYYINPNYQGQLEGEKILMDDEIINVLGSNENEITNNDFSVLGKKLENNINDVNDVKLLFNYLDAII